MLSTTSKLNKPTCLDTSPTAAERSLLVKLKTECGYQFTSKLESMFTDIKTSRDVMADFRAHLADKVGSVGLFEGGLG